MPQVPRRWFSWCHDWLYPGGVKKDGKVFWNLVSKDNTPHGWTHTHLSPLTPTITTQTQVPTPPPATSTTTQATNGATKEDAIHKAYLENIACWTAQTQVIREQNTILKDLSASVRLLVASLNASKIVK